jgi:hypothetical protein
MYEAQTALEKGYGVFHSVLVNVDWAGARDRYQIVGAQAKIQAASPSVHHNGTQSER